MADLRNAVFSKVTTDKPHYTQISFGGLRDIRFTLFNDYNYKLDQVILKVRYLRANMNEIKNETIIIKDFAPNSRQQLTSPDYTHAGTYIQIYFASVTCKAINLCFEEDASTVKIATTVAAPASNENSINDPYKCK